MRDEDFVLGIVIGMVVATVIVLIATLLVSPHYICQHNLSTTYTAVINNTQTVTAVVHSITNSTMTTGEVCKP